MTRSPLPHRLGRLTLIASLLLGLALAMGTAGVAGAAARSHKPAKGAAHATSASAAGSTLALSVTPFTGLDPTASTVTIAGSGYLPNTAYYVAECNPKVPAGGACDMVHFQEATSDATGAFSLTMTVDAQFGVTNCMTVACAVQTSDVGDPTDLAQEATVGINFTGGPPPYRNIFGKAPPPPPGYNVLGQQVSTKTSCAKVTGKKGKKAGACTASVTPKG